jgi:hypothetical protein
MMQKPIDGAVLMTGATRAMLTLEAMTELEVISLHHG